MTPSDKTRLSSIYLWAVIVVFMGGVTLYLYLSNRDAPSAQFRGPTIDPQKEFEKYSELEEWIPPIISGYFRSGESFYDLMKRVSVTDSEILEISKSSRPVFPLRRMRAGQHYRMTFGKENLLQRFEYDVDDDQMLGLVRTEKGWQAEITPIQYEVQTGVVRGTIEDSLYLSLVKACESPGLAIKLAEIYEWDIDFAMDLRKGDEYGILYEQLWREGQYVGAGRILATRFVNQGEVFNAIYYESQGKPGDYYDQHGVSLQKQFLKSPLRYKYISSYFSKSRMHPILKIRRPHLGVDYAAAHGTPVRASADGRVVFIGRKGGMGKMIKIRHNATYSTAYGHLSSYGKNLKKGRAVKQGEVIGYVGSTGISTGPHLHYSFFKNGKLVNPMRIENPKAKRIHSSESLEFKELAEMSLEKIKPAESTRIVNRRPESST